MPLQSQERGVVICHGCEQRARVRLDRRRNGRTLQRLAGESKLDERGQRWLIAIGDGREDRSIDAERTNESAVCSSRDGHIEQHECRVRNRGCISRERVSRRFEERRAIDGPGVARFALRANEQLGEIAAGLRDVREIGWRQAREPDLAQRARERPRKPGQVRHRREVGETARLQRLERRPSRNGFSAETSGRAQGFPSERR